MTATSFRLSWVSNGRRNRYGLARRVTGPQLSCDHRGMAATPAPVATRTGARPAVRYGCGTALAIFTALLVTAVLVIMQWMHAGATPATRTAPETISGSVVLLDDGSTIAYSDPNTLCGSASLAAAQTRTRVVLSLHANYEPNCRGFGLGPSQSSPVSPLDPAAAIWQPGWADPNMPA